MGLFSRRTKPGTDEGGPDSGDQTAERGIEPGEQPVDPDGPDAAVVTEPVADVGISVSSFRGVGAPSAPAAVEPAPTAVPALPGTTGTASTSTTAPAPESSILGVRDNVLLREALAALPEQPEARDLVNVARQLLQGHLFLRVQGDARALMAAGRPLPLAMAVRGDRHFVLAYSGVAALQASARADNDTSGSVIAQPVLEVLRSVLSGPFEGLVIDNASTPARAVLPMPLLRRAVDEADEKLRLKTLVSAPRTPATVAQVAEALTEASVWIAVKATDEGGPLGVAEVRTETGERYLEVFSHPLETLALDRGDRALPVTTVQLATALARDEDLSGVVIDRGGPSMRLSRADLAALLALAEG